MKDQYFDAIITSISIAIFKIFLKPMQHNLNALFRKKNNH